MISIRTAFKAYQVDAFDKKPIFPSSSELFQVLKSAEGEINRMQLTNNFSDYEEALFYKQKFEALYHITLKYESEKTKMSKAIHEEQARALLSKDYHGVSISQSKIVTLKKNDVLVVPGSGVRSNNKSPLKEFFDSQQAKKATSKVTFTSILANQQTPFKYGLRSISRSKQHVSRNLNDEQIRKLKDENHKLRNQLESERSSNLTEDKISDLRSQISDLSEQNRRLKIEVSSRVGSQLVYLPEEEYDPYNIKIRQNNIMKINSRNICQSERASQYGEEFVIKPIKSNNVYFDNQSEVLKSDFTHNPLKHATGGALESEKQLLNSSYSTIQTQYLNLQQQELQNQQKNHICREKIAFFKKQMVLYKTQQFDIAFKKSELNAELDKLRIILYVNNKTQKRVITSINYDYEREDFDLIIKKKMQIVDKRGQGREQIQIFFKNPSDLGSLITAKILVGSVMKKITVPALFINFDPHYRLQFQDIGYIQRNLSASLTLKPMGQFSSFVNASNILELQQQSHPKGYPSAKLYGKSKITKGIVRLTWKGDRLKIQTCEQWRTLMGYLFMNAEETIHV